MIKLSLSKLINPQVSQPLKCDRENNQPLSCAASYARVTSSHGSLVYQCQLGYTLRLLVFHLHKIQIKASISFLFLLSL